MCGFLFISLEGKKMKKGIKGIVLSLWIILMLVACASPAENKDDIKVIGVLQWVTHPALDATLTGLQDELEAQGIDSTKVEWVIKNADGQAANADLIAKQFVSDGVDLIYAIATPAAQAAVNATLGSDLPVVFNAVTDAVVAGLVETNERPGGNVTGVSDAAPLELQIQLIKDFLPEAQKIGMLYNLGEVNGKIQVEQVQALSSQFNLEVVAMGVTNNDEIASAMTQLVSEVDAIYNITDNLIVTATSIIVDKANSANIPVFAAENGAMDLGLLAVDGLSYEKLGRQAGSIVNDILFNQKSPAEIAVSGAVDTSLEINVKVAELLGITIPESLKARATLVE